MTARSIIHQQMDLKQALYYRIVWKIRFSAFSNHIEYFLKPIHSLQWTNHYWKLCYLMSQSFACYLNIQMYITVRNCYATHMCSKFRCCPILSNINGCVSFRVGCAQYIQICIHEKSFRTFQLIFRIFQFTSLQLHWKQIE